MKKILIIESRFYEDIADMLMKAAVTTIERSDYKYETISVPGAFEIPAAVSMAINSGKFGGYVTLGCVIRGETSHYDHVCTESARGLCNLAVQHHAAIGYGIITAENMKQALVRADMKGKNMGGRAAYACIEMMKLQNKWAFK